MKEKGPSPWVKPFIFLALGIFLTGVLLVFLKGQKTQNLNLAEPPPVFSGPPSVQFVDPEDSAIISRDQIVTVMFSQPILKEGGSPGSFLKIEPPAEGRIEWLNESTFQFIPREWVYGTAYSLTIPEGILGASKERLAAPFAFQLNTPAFKVVRVSPGPQTPVFPETPLEVEFNQPVNLEEIKPGNNVLLFPSNDLDALKNPRKDGFFNTEVTYALDKQGHPDRRRLVFKPTFPFQAGQEYEWILKASENQKWLKEDFKWIFKPQAQEPPETPESDLSWKTPEEVLFFEEGKPPTLDFAKTPSKTLEVEICPISRGTFLNLLKDFGWRNHQCQNPDSKKTKPGPRLNLAELFKKPFKPGLYRAVVSDGSNQLTQLFFVTDTLLFIKKSEGHLFLWAVNAAKKAPLPDLPLTVFSRDGVEVARGQTDENGIYQINRPLETGTWVIAAKEGSQDWSLTGDLWAVGESEPDFARVYFYLDQSRYAPGDSFFFFGLYHSLSLPFRLMLEDEAGNFIAEWNPHRGRYGSLYGQGEIPRSLIPGRHRFVLEMQQPKGEPEQILFPVWIDPPSSSDFKLKGHFLKEPQLQKPFELELQARSAQSGLTASGAVGISHVLKRPIPIPPLKEDRVYSWGPWKGLSCLRSLCAESEIKTGPSFSFDDRGKAQVSFNPDSMGLTSDFDALFKVQGFAGQDYFSHPFYWNFDPDRTRLGLSADRYWTSAGNALDFNLAAVKTSGEPVPGTKVQVMVEPLEKKSPNVAFKKTFFTANSPVAFTIDWPRGSQGAYRVKAAGKDSRGNPLVAEVVIYLFEKSPSNGKELLILPDQPEYLVGGKARLLLVPPAFFPETQKVWVGTEVVELKKGEPRILERLITEAMVPRMNFTVTYPGSEGWVTEVIPLLVSRRDQAIEVGLKSRIIQNNEEKIARVEIKTEDYQKRPVLSQVSVLIQESESEFSGSPSDPLEFFYPYQSPSSGSALPAFFENSKTFYFNATVKTDAGGQALVEVPLPPDFKKAMVHAIAVSDLNRLGKGETLLESPQSLVMELRAPASLTPGDEVRLGVDLFNPFSADFKTQVELIAPGLELKEGAKKSVTLSPGQTLSLEWLVKAPPKSSSSASVAFRTPETFVTHDIQIKSADRPTPRPLPSLEALSNQILLSFLEGKESSEAQKLLQALHDRDGGYVFLPTLAEPDPFFSAYALFALKTGGALQEDFRKVIPYLWQTLNSKQDLNDEERVFILWALSQAEAYDTRQTVDLVQKRQELPVYSQALLMMNIDQLIRAGQKSLRPFLERLKSDLADQIKSEGKWHYFEETKPVKFGNSFAFTTAIVAMALARVSPENPLLSPLFAALTAKNAVAVAPAWVKLAFKESKLAFPELAASAAPFLQKSSVDFSALIKRESPLPLKKGETDAIRLTLVVPKPLDYAVVEAPLPGGLKGLHFVSPLNLEARDTEEQKALLEGYDWLQNPIWHFQFHQIESDRVILFAPHLPQGVYTIEFTVEAVLSGRFAHLPAQVYPLFDPDSKAETKSEMVFIKE